MVRDLTVVLTLWAAIYLSALGSLEIKGEEGRRILPAVTMLETGNYIVPVVGSEPYLRKPPLINWLVAASFQLFGSRNEWTARIPSAFSILAVAIAFLTVARSSLGRTGALIAAIIWLTTFGMIEKGRLIELEALYVSLFGVAIVCWLSWWQQNRSHWLIWTVPFVFLGLGLLAKGPLHLIFFYAVVVAVLWRSAELARLTSVAHFAGIAIMLAIFAAWAIPYFQMLHGAEVTHVWSRQFSGRLAGEDFRFRGWLLNIPRAVVYFLPWLFLTPLIGTVQFTGPRKQVLAGALKWGITVPFVAVSLVPGSLPRYTMPLLVPATWLLAMTLSETNVKWPDWLGGKAFSTRLRFRWISALAIITGLALLIYAFAVVPRLQQHQKVKLIAAKINAIVPESECLYAVDPDYQPFLFYVRSRVAYLSRIRDLPPQAHYFLVQPPNEHAAEISDQWRPLRARPVLHIEDYRNRQTVLFAIGPS